MNIRRLPSRTDDSYISQRSHWIDRLAIYQTAMDHEQSVRTNYQILLTTLKIALLSFIFTLNQFGITEHLWEFILLGILLCFPFGIACEYRARNVDVWRVLIVQLVQETDVEKAFREGKYQWIPYGKVGFRGGDLFGHWFERILITFLLLSWAYISWNFTEIPSIIRALGVIAPIVWITYAFQRFSPEGDIMMPDLSER